MALSVQIVNVNQQYLMLHQEEQQKCVNNLNVFFTLLFRQTFMQNSIRPKNANADR